MLYGEKDPTFKTNARLEGNYAIVPHPNLPQHFGNGSLLVDEQIYCDFFSSATPGSNILLKSPLNYQIKNSAPILPSLGQTQLYASTNFDGRLVMVDPEGKIIDMNPIQKVGDLMTFDGIKETTVRMPVGLPNQQLQCDPWMNYLTTLTWKSPKSNVHRLTQKSSAYVRYLELATEQDKNLTGTSVKIPFIGILRNDTDAYSVGSDDFTILQAGMYEITCKLTIGYDLTNGNMSSSEIATVEMYLENSSVSGYIVTPGSRTYLTIPSHEFDRPYSSMTHKCYLDISAGTILRVQAREYGTTTGLMVIKAELSTISMKKLVLKTPATDISQYVMVRGSDGARPALSTTYVNMSLNTTIYRTNTNDVVSSNTVTVNNSGIRQISGKITVIATNINSNAQAVVQCRIVVDSNPVGQLYEGTIVGNSSIISISINDVINLQASNTIAIQCRISPTLSNITTGTLNVVAESCILEMAYWENDAWTNIYLGTNSSLLLKSNQYQTIDLPVVVQENTIAYTVLVNKSVQVKAGGSYTILFQTTIENLDTSIYSSFVRAMADVGSGFTEIPGSMTYVTLSSNAVQTIFFATVVFLPPNGIIQIEGLSVDGGNIQLRDDTSKLIVSQIENNMSSFTGLPEFGRFYKYVFDNQVVVITSTTFVQRLAAVTINLPVGMYRIQITLEWDMSNSGVGLEIRLRLDNTTTLETYSVVPNMTGFYRQIILLNHVELSEEEHILSLQTRVLSSNRSLLTKNVRMEFWRTL